MSLKHPLLFLFITIFSHQNLAQEEIFSRPIDLKQNAQVHFLKTKNSDEGSILTFANLNQLTFWKFDENNSFVKELTIPRPKRSYSQLLGNTASEETKHLFFANNKTSKFFVQQVDIDNLSYDANEFKFKTNYERILGTFEYKNKLYTLAIRHLSSLLKIYVFEGNQFSHVKEVDLSEYKFYDGKSIKPLSSAMLGSPSIIDIESPVSMSSASNKAKVYTFNNKLFFTYENSKEETNIVSVDLESFEHQLKTVPTEEVDCNNAPWTVSNSFLTKEHFFQIVGCKNEIAFWIKDPNTFEPLGEYRSDNEGKIDFANTKIFMDGAYTFIGSSPDSVSISTNSALRNIAKGNIAITALYQDNKLVVTMGGVKTYAQGAGGAPALGSGSTTIMSPGGPVQVSTPSAGTMQFLNYEERSQTIEFRSLIDPKSFKHISGDVDKNVFDLISEFTDGIQNEISHKEVIKIDDYYLLGYYHKKDKVYKLFKFLEPK